MVVAVAVVLAVLVVSTYSAARCTLIVRKITTTRGDNNNNSNENVKQWEGRRNLRAEIKPGYGQSEAEDEASLRGLAWLDWAGLAEREQVLSKWQTMPQGIGAISAQLIDLRHFLCRNASPHRTMGHNWGPSCDFRMRQKSWSSSSSSPCLRRSGISGIWPVAAFCVAAVLQLRSSLSLSRTPSRSHSCFMWQLKQPLHWLQQFQAKWTEANDQLSLPD